MSSFQRQSINLEDPSWPLAFLFVDSQRSFSTAIDLRVFVQPLQTVQTCGASVAYHIQTWGCEIVVNFRHPRVLTLRDWGVSKLF